MCCVGTKNLLRDYDYVVRRFIDSGAISKETALPYDKLEINEAEHLFARDNFMSLLFSGDIRRTRGGYYLKNSHSTHFARCPLTKKALRAGE